MFRGLRACVATSSGHGFSRAVSNAYHAALAAEGMNLKFSPTLLGPLKTALAFRRLRMDRHSRDLRKLFFHAVFQRRRHVMHLRDRQRALHSAVAGSEDVVLHLAH